VTTAEFRRRAIEIVVGAGEEKDPEVVIQELLALREHDLFEAVDLLIKRVQIHVASLSMILADDRSVFAESLIGGCDRLDRMHAVIQMIEEA
jgi:hypothetical protein